MIPDVAGKVIEIVTMGYGLRLWTDDNREIILGGPIVVTGAGAPPEEVVTDVESAPAPARAAGA